MDRMYGLPSETWPKVKTQNPTDNAPSSVTLYVGGRICLDGVVKQHGWIGMHISALPHPASEGNPDISTSGARPPSAVRWRLLRAVH